MDYLGFEFSSQGFHALAKKVKAILQWPKPQIVHDIRSFWGLAWYCQGMLAGLPKLQSNVKILY